MTREQENKAKGKQGQLKAFYRLVNLSTKKNL